jgi:hypothetical protein
MRARVVVVEHCVLRHRDGASERAAQRSHILAARGDAGLLQLPVRDRAGLDLVELGVDGRFEIGDGLSGRRRRDDSEQPRAARLADAGECRRRELFLPDDRFVQP